MSHNDEALPDWDMEEWEEALTINVGTAYRCRTCGNIVMVTRGGVGVMELICCGIPMDLIDPRASGKGART
jgi:desulfoferrodoxin-like iron-binding protein